MNGAAATFESAIALSKSVAFSSEAQWTGEGLYQDRFADWYELCCYRIDLLRQLKSNWDSYGANPVDWDSIDFAKKLVGMLAKGDDIECPRVAASPEGLVALSWEWKSFSRELDVEVQPDGKLRFSYLNECDPSHDSEGVEFNPGFITRILTE